MTARSFYLGLSYRTKLRADHSPVWPCTGLKTQTCLLQDLLLALTAGALVVQKYKRLVRGRRGLNNT